MFFFFKQKTAYEMRISDWSSDVCSSDLLQIEVSRYLFTITAINVGLGGATAAAMAMLGLPDPLLWGVLAAILNFIPYAGPILTVGAILLASVVTFSTPVAVFLPRSEERRAGDECGRTFSSRGSPYH